MPSVFQWRPSRWVTVALVAMTAGAGLALLVSGVPAALKPPLIACTLAWGVLVAWREHRRPARVFVIRSDTTATLDTMPLDSYRVHWRGTLAFLHARDARGRAHRLAFWPDTLDAHGRRALRLAVG